MITEYRCMKMTDSGGIATMSMRFFNWPNIGPIMPFWKNAEKISAGE